MPESVDPKSKFFFFNIHLRVIIIRSSIGIIIKKCMPNYCQIFGGYVYLPIISCEMM